MYMDVYVGLLVLVSCICVYSVLHSKGVEYVYMCLYKYITYLYPLGDLVLAVEVIEITVALEDLSVRKIQ